MQSNLGKYAAATHPAVLCFDCLPKSVPFNLMLPEAINVKGSLSSKHDVQTYACCPHICCCCIYFQHGKAVVLRRSEGKQHLRRGYLQGSAKRRSHVLTLACMSRQQLSRILVSCSTSAVNMQGVHTV